jgi:adenylate kinase
VADAAKTAGQAVANQTASPGAGAMRTAGAGASTPRTAGAPPALDTAPAAGQAAKGSAAADAPAPQLGGGGRPLRIVLLGPPNAGKGTQAEMLRSRLGVPGISTGDMLRREAASGTPLGRRVKSIMDSGDLVDDATMAEVVRERLRQADGGRGFLLDGYPRTLAQAETLAAILAAAGRPLDAVLLIAVPEAELERRALARGRSDDREEVIRERLRVYREKTEPLIGYYRRLGLLREVDGHRPIEEVGRQLLAGIEAHPA